MTQTQTDPPAQPVVRSGRTPRWSWIWLVPLLAVVMGATLVASYWLRTGPTITIRFETAQDLVPGQTKLRYRDVAVGSVKDIDVAEDRDGVLVRVQLDSKNAKYIAQKSAHFWVVRPRFSLNGVSGLGTLVSGAYLSVDVEAPYDPDAKTYEFTGLETPPEITGGREGTRYVLQAQDLGSLEIGSSIYYRRVVVGRVIGYQLSDTGTAVNIQVFVDAPYDRFVTEDARFWNVSGIDVQLSSEGLSLRTGSLGAVLGGGLAFGRANEGSSLETTDVPMAKANSLFPLFDTQDAAMADPDGIPFPIEMHFDQSVRGLKVGASVDFRGMELGKVVDIDLEYDPEKQRFYARVRADLYPLRFADAYRSLLTEDPERKLDGRLLGPLIRHGLRAQMRPANLLSGQQFIALDFFPDADPVDTPQHGSSPILIPTTPGNFDQLQQQVSRVMTRIDGIPFDEIGQSLDESLKAMRGLLGKLDGQLLPQASGVLKSARQSLDQVGKALGPKAPVIGNLQESLGELTRAARALRALADYLQAHPESLVRGHPSDTLR